MNQLGRQFILDFILESEAIEKLGFKRRTYNENVGHWAAIKYVIDLAKKKLPLQESDIKKINELIAEEYRACNWKSYRNTPGEYREFDIKKKSFLPPHCRRIPSMMKCFIRKVNKWQNSFGRHCEEQNIEKIGRFHHWFEKIHPFADGNGRTGRVIALYMILFLEFEPFIFRFSDKGNYYAAFQNKNKMAAYFVNKYQEVKEMKKILETRLKIQREARDQGNI